jgi:hypothetical protein
MKRSWSLSLIVLGVLVGAPTLRAQEDPGAVARIVRVESTAPLRVTLKVDIGYLVNGKALDVFSPKGKTTATPTFPKNIDLLMTGDSVAGVTLLLAQPLDLVGGVVAEQSRYANFAATQQGALKGAVKAAPISPAASSPAATTDPCPYTTKELSTVLGITVSVGRGKETPFSGGVSSRCSYSETAGLRSVMIAQTRMSAADWAYSRSTWDKQKAGSFEAIANDPDGARWQIGQGDLTGVTLVYLRRNAEIEVRVNGVDMKNAAAVKAMRDRVVALRRLP